MKSIIAGCLLLFGGVVLISRAAEPPTQPSPEIQKMKVYVGKWHLEEDDEESPFGSAFHATLETEFRFIHNGFFLEEAGSGKDSNGNPSTYSILYYYDPATGTLRSFLTDSTGTAVQTTGRFEKNTWSNEWTQEVKGKKYKCKSTAVIAS